MASESAHPMHETDSIIAPLIGRARVAMAAFKNADQARVDEVVTALAWSVYCPDNARALAETAVRDTGLGNVADKITKNQRKTFGTNTKTNQINSKESQKKQSNRKPNRIKIQQPNQIKSKESKWGLYSAPSL